MRLVPFRSRLRRRGEEFGLAPSMRSEFDRMFDRMLRAPWFEEIAPQLTGSWSPSVDISESESEFTIRAEVPGISPDEIELTVSGDRLIISGEKSEQHEEKEEHYYHAERRFGAFERSIDLPSIADLEKVRAEHANGVLTIHVPKHETAKPKRVEIQAKADDGHNSKSVSVPGMQ